LDAPPVLLAVLGHPVAHSLSPAMHEAGFAATGRQGRYVACDVPPERLAAAVAGLGALGFAGCNCTVPLKEAACALADRRSPEAAATGSANTLAFRSGEVFADTTDGRGLLRALREEAGWEPAGCRALVLGAGGTARSVVAALRRAGAEVAVANRTLERARRLAAEIDPRVTVLGLGGPELEAALARADVLIHCTSVGMDGSSLPLPAEALQALPATALVCDVVYAPREETPLLAAARARGLRTVGGIGMLAWQAALAWEVWFGETGPADVFAAVARRELRRRTGG
jgi:shikimate dehydrogenase